MTGMTGKTCLVTGATGGIGKATATALARLGATVVIVARNRQRGDGVAADIRQHVPNAVIDLVVADLGSQSQVRQLAAEVRKRHPRLDVLINNAAVVNAERRVTDDGLEATFAVNHLAPFLLTQLLTEPLMAAAPSRVVNVTSYLHNMVKSIPWDDLQAESNYRSHAVYNLTKLMNVLFTYQLAKRWRGEGISANCLHPGWPLRTDLGREEHGLAGLFDRASKLFASSAEVGSRTTVYLASSPDVAGISGSYFANCKEARSSQLSHDEVLAQRLWERSAELCALSD